MLKSTSNELFLIADLGSHVNFDNPEAERQVLENRLDCSNAETNDLTNH